LINPFAMQLSLNGADAASHAGPANAPCRKAAASNPAVKWMAPAILLLSVSAAPAAILCQDAPGRERGVHWSWRDIDGKQCWFKRVGTIPPKTELRWEKPRTETLQLEPAPVNQATPNVRILKTRIEWEGFSEVEANWIDGDAPVDLMRPESISGPSGVGGSWVVPSQDDNADEPKTFAARFAPIIETRKPRIAVP
jgi:hypothetical protein